MRILFIHGRAQGGKDPDALEQVWIDTLKDGMKAAGLPESRLSKVSIDFPFYGDDLDRFTEQAKLAAAPAGAKGVDTYSDFDRFYAEVISELESHNSIADSEINSELPPTAETEKGLTNWEWVHAVARVIDRHLTGVSKFSIEAFMRDVYLYLTNDNVRNAINKIVIDKLTEEPTVVVGHSLGTVVGYDVIRDHKNSHTFLKYVTLGSPLGIKGVSSHLGVVENPVGEKWFNGYDDRDVVALNPLAGRYFPVTPEILNYKEAQNDTDNAHGIKGYLNDATIARHIFAELP